MAAFLTPTTLPDSPGKSSRFRAGGGARGVDFPGRVGGLTAGRSAPTLRAGRVLPEETIAEVRDRVDIVALVGEYVRLRASGASFRGLCPFHDEKTPSFYVHRDRRFFHCFGCKASGDAIGFLMRMEGRSFIDVVRDLAERTGVDLPTLDSAEEIEIRRRRQRTQRLVEVMDAAAGYYVQMLAEHPHARIARHELQSRGITADTIAEYRLGYAPFGWSGLLDFLRREGFSSADAEALGLIVPRKSADGHYDRFRHRLMFPITDLHGRIVAFSGRRLDPPEGEDERESPAKYINSPEGPLYKKGEILYGLHEARVAIRREGTAILCEGNFDLLALHQAGFKTAVAPMGTALTPAHAKLLRRFVEQAYLLFDGDAAGRKAVRAAFPLLAGEGIGVQVVTFPAGMDPDGFLRERGADAMRERLSTAPGAVEHFIDEAADAAGAEARAKASAIASLGRIVASVDNPVEARLYVERIARRFGVSDVQAVRRQLRRGLSGSVAPSRGQLEGSRAPRSGGPGLGRVPGRLSASPRPATLPPLERELVSVFLDAPALLVEPEAKNLQELLTSRDLRVIFETVLRVVQTRGGVDGPALLAELSDAERRDDRDVDGAAIDWLEERLAIRKYDDDGALRALRDGIPRLARQKIEGELPLLQRKILDARRVGEDEVALRLTQQYDALFQSCRRLMHAKKR